MAIAASVSISQGTDKTKFIVTDSTVYGGVDTISNINNRSLRVYKSDGSDYYPPGTDYPIIAFPYAGGNSITLTGLDKDYGLKVVMTLNPIVTVSGSVYVDEDTGGMAGYGRTYFYERMVAVSSSPRLEQSQAFISDTMEIQMLTEVGVAAAESGDITTAQLCFDRARNIELYKQKPY